MIRGLKKLSDTRPQTYQEPEPVQRRPVGGGYAPQYGGMNLNEDDFYDEDFSDGEMDAMMAYGNPTGQLNRQPVGGMNYGGMNFEDEFGKLGI